jgi:serine/threonine protein kinase
MARMSRDPLLGRTLGGVYRIERRLGAGGIGAVYAATHARTGRKYAVKVLLSDVAMKPGAAERFRREAEALAALGHAGIVQIHDFDTADDGAQFLVMDLLEGEDLAARIAREGALRWEDALRVLEEIASALGAAHAVGLVHRDLKPGNVFLARRPGAGERATLLDFGLAKNVAAVEDVRLTATGAGLGTPLYMSPEQARGDEVDLRTDVYALGCILFEMLTGAPPFDGPTLTAVIARILTDPPPPVSRSTRHPVPPGVDAVVARALAKDPAERYASASALVEAARACGVTRSSPGADARLALTAPAVALDGASAHPLAATATPVPAGDSLRPARDPSGDLLPGGASPPSSPRGAVARTRVSSDRPRRPASLWVGAGAALLVVAVAAVVVTASRLESGDDGGDPAARGALRGDPARTTPGEEDAAPLLRAVAPPLVAPVAPARLPEASAAPGASPPGASDEAPAEPTPGEGGTRADAHDALARTGDARRDGPSRVGASEPVARGARGGDLRGAQAAGGAPAPEPTPLERQAAAEERLAAAQEALGRLVGPDAAADRLRADARRALATYESQLRPVEQRLREYDAFLALVAALRREARTVARGDEPAACRPGARAALQAYVRGENPAVAATARPIEAAFEEICTSFEDWRSPPPLVRQALVGLPREVELAERQLQQVESTASEIDVTRVRDAVAAVKRLTERASPDASRFPCRDDAMRLLRGVQDLRRDRLGNIASRLYVQIDQACRDIGMTEERLRMRAEALTRRCDNAETQIRQMIVTERDVADRLRAAIAPLRSSGD